MTRALRLESSFTSTIASLAPDPSTHEQLLPGALYVLVAAMAGSIVTRNRNVVLRATVPVAVGIGAGWVLLPHTMRNVGDLLWRYEQKVPVLAANHLRIRAAVEESIRQARSRGKSFGKWADDRVRDGRETIEGWVRKGG
jgi:MICOS complex subunit MIC26